MAELPLLWNLTYYIFRYVQGRKPVLLSISSKVSYSRDLLLGSAYKEFGCSCYYELPDKMQYLIAADLLPVSQDYYEFCYIQPVGDFNYKQVNISLQSRSDSQRVKDLLQWVARQPKVDDSVRLNELFIQETMPEGYAVLEPDNLIEKEDFMYTTSFRWREVEQSAIGKKIERGYMVGITKQDGSKTSYYTGHQPLVCRKIPVT